MAQTKQSAALGFIFVTIFIDVLGLGIIIPVLPKLLQVMGHLDVNQASKYIGWLTFVYAFMQLLFASIMGNLSDRFGRRPVLLISLFGFGLDYAVIAFAPTIAWLFVGRVIAGIYPGQALLRQPLISLMLVPAISGQQISAWWALRPL